MTLVRPAMVPANACFLQQSIQMCKGTVCMQVDGGGEGEGEVGVGGGGGGGRGWEGFHHCAGGGAV